MSDKHPYTPSSGHIVQVITHFRKSFPVSVTADTLKKLGFAPKNESYVLNIFRFLGLIDQEGNRTDVASKTFSIHDDATFSKEFAKIVMNAYSDLFDLQGENAWELSNDALITFFRSSDETTAIVGKLQTSTFQLLAAFSGYGVVPEPKTNVSKQTFGGTQKKLSKTKANTMDTQKSSQVMNSGSISSDHTDEKRRDFGLTVRIEINLPSDGDQETYNRIFKSIRENLLDG